MSQNYNFDSFDEMLKKFESDGHKVDRLDDECAVVFNNGVCPNYSHFDNIVATVADNNGFKFRTPADMEKLYTKTVKEGIDPSELPEDLEIYLGVCDTDDPHKIEKFDYEFRPLA